MIIEFRSSNQCLEYKDQLQGNIYQNLRSSANKEDWWLRFSALPVAMTSCLLDVSASIAAVAENILKGLGNVFLFLISKKFSLQFGLNQLLIQTPKHLIALPFRTLYSITCIFTRTISMLMDPKNHTLDMWKKYDNEGFHKVRFTNHLNTLSKNPNHKEASRVVAECYYYGQGTERNIQEAVNLYTRAANLGDVPSIVQLGSHYFQKQQYDEALGWLEMGAANGDINSAYKAAQIFENVNVQKALEYYKFAAKGGKIAAMEKYYLLVAVASRNGDTPEESTTNIAGEFCVTAAQSGSVKCVMALVYATYLERVVDRKQTLGHFICKDTAEEIRRYLTTKMLDAYQEQYINGAKESIHDYLFQLMPESFSISTKDQVVTSLSIFLSNEAINFLLDHLDADMQKREKNLEMLKQVNNPLAKLIILGTTLF